jgi:LuxR family maltose regulon positive regulatory protein
LDDYQFISSQAVHEHVAVLLDHCPTTFHLVLATRSDPPVLAENSHPPRDQVSKSG